MSIPHYAPHLLLALSPLVVSACNAAPEKAPDPPRVAEIAGMLPERPAGVGQPAADRVFWGRLAALPEYQGMVSRAERLLAEPLPPHQEELFLEYSRNGNRTRYQSSEGRRRGRLTTLVLAECVENRGRFVKPFEELVESLAAEPTWVLPAHDGKLANFNGTTIDIDLSSSALAWELATADYLLGDKLSAGARQRLRAEVQRRVLGPYKEMFTGARAPNWWMLTTNNWNAVCLAGVTGTALAQIESREERAQYVAAAEKYSRNFLRGFTPDGYCSEGLGYWNYGFGHYVLLAETLRQATAGKLDPFALPEVKAPATFGARIQIIEGVSPAFADCSVNSSPMRAILWYANHRYGLGLPGYEEAEVRGTTGSLFEAMVYDGATTAPRIGAGAAGLAVPEIRAWFEQAGILIGRPAPGSRCRMGVALKGGHNNEHHNHNDVGSYVVVLGERAVLLDPGGETYSARTFSSRRYESKLLNSFGHPVPVVAGQLQRTGADARAKVLQADLTDQRETLRLDLASAYAVPDLTTLERSFVYSREGEGSLTITDRVALKTPQSFGTAILTRGAWQRQEDGSLLITDGDEAVRVAIDAGGAEFALQAEEIREDAAVKPTRIGINLTKPVTSATVTVKVTPAAVPGMPENGSLLRNGGFEFGALGWDIPNDGLASLSTEQAATGKQSLKISDTSKGAGSNVNSSRFRVDGPGAYTLRGKVFHVSGEGIGLYVRYLDAQRRMLNEVDANGNLPTVGSLTGAAGKWAPFAFPFQAPEKTAYLQIWIHSFNGSVVEAYLDDLEIVRE